MTLARREALISLVVWGAALIGLASLVFIVGPERFSAPEYSRYRLVVAAVLLPGYLASAWAVWRVRRGAHDGEMDERDAHVARRASEITLIVVAVVLFGACNALWEVYKGGSGAPAGWFYVLAYFTVVLLAVVHAAARLICDVYGTANA